MDCTDETIDLRTLLQHLDDPTKPLVTLPVDHDNVRREISTLVLRWLHDNGFMSTLLSFRDELQTKHRSEHLAQKLLLQLARAIEEGDWDLAYQLAKKTEAAMNAATTHLQEQHQSLLQKPSTPPPQPQRPTTTNSTESLHPLHLVPNSHIPAQPAAVTTTSSSSGLPSSAVAAAAGSSAAGSNHSGSANSSFSATAGGDILGTTLMAGGRGGGAAEEGALNKTTPTHHSGAAATAAAALAMQNGVGAVGGSAAPNNTNGGGGSSATPTGLTSPTPPPAAAAMAVVVAPTSTAPPPASAGVNNNNNSTTSSTTTNVTPNAVTTTTTTTTTTTATSTSSGATTTAPTAGGSASTSTAAAVNNNNKTNNSSAAPPNNATSTTTTTSTAANGTVTWLLAQQQFFELVDEGDTTRAFAFFMRRLKPLESLVGIERFQVLTYLLTVKNLNEAAVRYPMLFAGWTPLSGRISLIQQIGQLLDATLNSPNAVSVLAGRWFRQRADSNLDPTTSSSSSTLFSVDPTSSNHHHPTTTVSLQTLFEQALSYQLLMLRAAKGGGGGRNNNKEEGEALERKLQSPTVDVSGPGLTEATSVMRPLASQQPPSKVALRVTTTAGPLTAVEPLLDYGGVVLGTATGELRWGLLVQQNNNNSSATTSVEYKGGPLVTLREQRLVQHFQPSGGTTRPEPLHHVRCLRTSATSSAAGSKYRDTLFVSASGSSVLLGALPTTLWSRRVCKVGEFPSLPLPPRPSGGDPFPSSSSSSLIPFAELTLPYEDDIRCALLTPCESFVICGTSAGDVILCDAQREEVALEGGSGGGSGDAILDPALLDGSSSGRSSSHSSPHMARCRTPMRTVRLTLQRVDTFPRRANGTVRRALESVGTASLPAAGGSSSGSSGCACTGLQCNATGTTLFVSYIDGFVQAFNLVTGTCTLQVAPPTPSAAAGAIALGPSRAPYFSNFLFVPYRHNGVRVYDICTGAVTPLRLEGPPSTPTASRSSSSSYGPCAVTAEFSSPFSSPSDRTAQTTTDHSDPGHMFFLAGTDEGSLHVWSLLHPKHFTCGTTTTSPGGVVRPVTTFHSLHQGPVTDVKVSNHCVVTVGLDGALCVCSP